MSLFKTRTFWSTTISEDDECYDQNSLLVTKLNSNSDYIVTGSHSGTLRVLKPSGELNENHIPSDYKVTDLLIEKVLDFPILQISCGRLVSGSTKYQLAVLHPRLFSIYSLTVKEGATDHGTQHILQELYQHKLRRSAACFIVGPFGGTQQRDFICVQSLDGMLSFFEQESFCFCCFLPDFLLPTPFIYVRKTDSFVTCNSNWLLTSYKYKLLSEAGQNSDENDSTGKKIQADWSYNLGESVIDIQVVDEPDMKENSIVVLGERNYFCVGDSGRLKFMKKLEYSPICFTNYTLHEKIISLIVSETSTLLIYENTTLKWSAQLQLLPITIERAIFENIVGALVFLSEQGQLECCYLGTDPSLFVAPPLLTQELDFDKTALELSNLNKIIRSTYTADIKVTNASAERELVIKIIPSPRLETCSYSYNIQNPNINIQMCSVTIEVVPQAIFEEIQLTIFVHRPLKAVPAIEYFNNLSEKTTITCDIFLMEAAEIVSLNLEVYASFVSNLGIPRSVSKMANLPLNLVMENCPPQKEGEFKVTLNINQNPISLAQLFPEFMDQNNFNTSNSALGIKNLTEEGKPVTILLAKSSDRYRLQSDSLSSLTIIIEQIVLRLRKHHNDNLIITYNSPLHIIEIQKYVNRHFEARRKHSFLNDELSQLSFQFRLIQKRLISKFKVKNPTPLTNLEMLLQDTYSEIIRVAEAIEISSENLIKSQISLACILNLIKNLMQLMDINNNAISVIESVFSVAVYDLDGQNWEDTMDASLCYLLRTILAKSDKDKLRAAHTSFDQIKDINKLEKHLSQVLERIPKGGLLETHFNTPSSSLDEGIVKDDKSPPNKEEEEAAVPIGTRMAESSARVMSARHGVLLRRRQKMVEA